MQLYITKRFHMQQWREDFYKRASFFKQLAENILSDKTKEHFTYLGQECFCELKLNMQLDDETNYKKDVELTRMISFGFDMSQKNPFAHLEKQ